MAMEQSVWLATGAAAAVALVLSTLARATPNVLFAEAAPSVQVGGAAVAALLAARWGLAAFAVEQTTNTGSVVLNTYPGLGVFGLVVAVIATADLLFAVLDIVGEAPETALGGGPGAG